MSEQAQSATFLAASERSAAVEARLTTHPEEFRMLTGDRPTGALHIGHYFGSLVNRVKLQELGAETWVIVADYQVITDREIAGDIRGSVRELITDYLAVGIDPERSTIFTHSAVPALNQLLLPFLSLVSVAELQRNPTVKDEAASAGIKAISGLMLTYPVHQAADILFCKGNVVPVGKDQLPHIEQTRVVARRFNERYGPVFPEPAALLSATLNASTPAAYIAGSMALRRSGLLSVRIRVWPWQVLLSSAGIFFSTRLRLWSSGFRGVGHRVKWAQMGCGASPGTRATAAPPHRLRTPSRMARQFEIRGKARKRLKGNAPNHSSTCRRLRPIAPRRRSQGLGR